MKVNKHIFNMILSHGQILAISTTSSLYTCIQVEENRILSGSGLFPSRPQNSRCGHTTVVKCQIIVLFLYGEYTIRIFAEAAVLALPARSICFVFLAD